MVSSVFLTPQGRVCPPHRPAPGNVVTPAVHAASDAADAVTGQIVFVDGGYPVA